MKRFILPLLILVCFIASPVLAQQRGPQQFTITQPDGSMQVGQYVPNTGQIIIQSPISESPTVLQQAPNHNWQVIQSPPAYFGDNSYDSGVVGGDD